MTISKSQILFRCIYIFILNFLSSSDYVCCSYNPPSREDQASGIVGQKLYFYGGQDHSLNKVYEDFFSLDLSTNFSTAKPPFQLENFGSIGPIAAGTSVVGDTTFYIFGGVNSTQPGSEKNDLFSIDLSSSSPSWKHLSNKSSPNSPSPRKNVAMVYSDGLLYVWGGSGINNVINDTDLHIYDTKQNSWSVKSLPNAPKAISSHTMTLLPDGRIFIINVESMETIFVFNINIQQWTTTTAILPSNITLDFSANVEHTATLGPDNTTIIIVYDNPTYPVALLNINSEKYSILTNEFLFPPVYAHTADLYNHNLFVAFGLQNSGTTNDASSDSLRIFSVFNNGSITPTDNNIVSTTNLPSPGPTSPDPTSSSPTSPSPTSPDLPDHTSPSPVLITGFVLGGIIIVVVSIAFLWWRKKRRSSKTQIIEIMGSTSG